MSFGFSVGDVVLLSQLAWRTVEGSRKACGEHDELTREVTSLHHVLQRVTDELSNPNSPINRVEVDDSRRMELWGHVENCEQILKVIDTILRKYNALGEDKKNGKKLWQKIKFGNGEMKDLSEMRLKISTHTTAITLSLNLFLLGSQGRVEKQLEDQGGDLRGIRESVNWIYSKMSTASHESSILTSYTNDDKRFWRGLRRELVSEGYPSSSLRRHKELIKEYLIELGQRGVLDDDVEAKSMEPTDATSRLCGSPPDDSNEAVKVTHDPLSPSLVDLPECGSSKPGSIYQSVHVEEVLDEDFAPDAHPNVEGLAPLSPTSPQNSSASLDPRDHHYPFAEILETSPKDGTYPSTVKLTSTRSTGIFDQSIVGEVAGEQKPEPKLEIEEEDDSGWKIRRVKKNEKGKRGTPVDGFNEELEVEIEEGADSGWRVEGYKKTGDEVVGDPIDQAPEPESDHSLGVIELTSLPAYDGEPTYGPPGPNSSISDMRLRMSMQDGPTSWSKYDWDLEHSSQVATPGESEDGDAVPESSPMVDVRTRMADLERQIQEQLLLAANHRIREEQEARNTALPTDVVDMLFSHTTGFETKSRKKTFAELSAELKMEAIKEEAEREAEKEAEREAEREAEKHFLPIKFRDAIGRKFSIPFNLVKTWAGMEEFIKQGFGNTEDPLSLNVRKGFYDLVAEGTIILPQVWETMVEPGWVVIMLMWPMPDTEKKPVAGLPSLISPKSKRVPRSLRVPRQKP